MKLLSVKEWADKYKVPHRRAYRWAQEKKLDIVTRTIEVQGVPSTFKLKDVKLKTRK